MHRLTIGTQKDTQMTQEAFQLKEKFGNLLWLCLNGIKEVC